MSRSDWEKTPDLEVILRAASASSQTSLLRRFACECCRRVSHLCADPIYFRLLEFSEGRTSGSNTKVETDSLRSDSSQLYDVLYPGYGSPSAAVLALTAAGEAAYTESSVDAAINASATAALAVAVAEAAKADDADYDVIHEAAYYAERRAQLNLLSQLDPSFVVSSGGNR